MSYSQPEMMSAEELKHTRDSKQDFVRTWGQQKSLLPGAVLTELMVQSEQRAVLLRSKYSAAELFLFVQRQAAGVYLCLHVCKIPRRAYPRGKVTIASYLSCRCRAPEEK